MSFEAAKPPGWVTARVVWDDYGHVWNGAPHTTSRVHLYARQERKPNPIAGESKWFYGGACGSWFDVLFTADRGLVTCPKCKAAMNEEGTQ